MSEVLLLMLLLFAAYLFMPTAWFFKDKRVGKGGESAGGLPVIPEDSVLRRHFITQLRSEIELELSPRPTDSTLQRHYDAMVNVELENRLTAFEA